MSALLTSLRESASREDLLAWIEGAIARHDARVTELLQANNREVERRRAAERCRELLREATDWGLIYWEPITTKGHIAKAGMLARIDAALTASQGEQVRHLKRGTSYGVAFRGVRVQTSRPIIEGDSLVVYVAEADGTPWARLPEEFDDGRFEPIAAPEGASA